MGVSIGLVLAMLAATNGFAVPRGGARGAIRAVLLTLLLSAPLPSGAEAPEIPAGLVHCLEEE